MIREYIYFVDDNPNGTSGMTEEEVVRCKDCKRYDKGENESCSWEMCKRTKASVSDTDFCSFGERGEE